MNRLGARQVLFGILVWLLFSPVVLATGSPAFRLSLYRTVILGVPAFPLLIMVLLVILVALVWVFAGAAFSDTDERP